MNRLFDPHFLVLMVKTQWRDRIVTSSFLIGITIQTFLLSFAIWMRAVDANDGLILAIRASCFTSVGILLFSAMSSIQNEFRFGTIENVLLGERGLNQLVIYRAFATTLICSPAVLAPFLFEFIRFPHAGGMLRSLAVIGLIYVFVFSLCYQLSYLINAFAHPSASISILKFVILLIGLRLVPGAWATPTSLVMPSGWILSLARQELLWWQCLTGFALTVALLTAATYWWLRPRVEASMERRMVSGRLV
jgi:hypothetical protein